jgi:hypothetical protein
MLERGRGIASFMLLALALVGACQDTSAVSEEVGDFSEISEAAPTIEPSSDGTSAVLTVVTTIEAVCAVAYGDTTSMGRLATDQEMGVGGHSEHEAVLTGLSPDTEYFYRLQGVGADGRLYRSEILTFRTPPAPEASSDRNAAIEADVVDVSSEFSAAFGGANAIDGDLATEWSTSGDGDDAYLVIDLGREVEVAGIGFHTRSMSDGTAISESFTITVDDTDTFGPFPVGRADVSFSGRIVRFDVDRSTGGNTGAAEVEVLERS